MNWRIIPQIIGPLLLVAVVAASIIQVFRTKSLETDTNIPTVRIAHWQLESGLRDALDAVIEEYKKVRPDVRVEQVPVPERLGKNWARTQLVGGTAPTIFQIGGVMGITDETLARYFMPISDYIDDPNPYNEGTDLESTPWRETFLDNLTSPPAYSPVLLDYYGTTSTLFVIRIYYNVELLKEITGSYDTPKTYQEFLDLCVRVLEYNVEQRDAGNPVDILPIAGSKYNAPFMMMDLFSAVTQRFHLEELPDAAMTATADNLVVSYLRGDWDWNTPQIRLGLEVMREVGQFMQPGFMQLGRDDAMFYFAQGRALMISTGSFDATSIKVQSPFEVGVFKMPIPAAEDPAFSEYVLGPFSEGSTGGGFVLGIVRDAPHIDDAVDFLQFLTSKRGSEILSSTSGWLPGTVGVELPEEMKPFQPLLDGYPKGVDPRFGNFPDTVRIYENNLHRLVTPSGSVEDFATAMNDDMQRNILGDLRVRERNIQRNSASRDSAIAGFEFLRRAEPEGNLDRKVSESLEGQNANDLLRYRLHQAGEQFRTNRAN